MKERIITAVVLIIVIFGFLLCASDYLFGAGVFFVATLAAYEWLKLSRVSPDKFDMNIVIFAVATFISVALFKYLQFVFALFWIYAVFKLYQYENEKISFISTNGARVLGLFAVVPFSASLYVLDSNGLSWVFILIFAVSTADSCAYFIGKSVGKKKMLPRLSPNKTIEGLVGGVICSIVVSALLIAFLQDLGFVQYVAMVVISAFAALMSVAGDVFESMMKRIAGVKDSGTILPGHGGILDRIDGYLPALPIFVTLGYVVGVFTV